MAKYQVETDQGTFEIETEEPSQDHPDYIEPGKEKTFAEKASPYYHTALEAGGALVGGLAAAPGSPLASAAGGALGFAGGKAAANLLDRSLGVSSPINPDQALKETGKNIYEGVKNEATGLAVGAGLGAAKRAIQGPIAKGYGKISQLMSGVKGQDIERAVNDPSLVLPKWAGGPMQRKEAGALLGQAEKDAGFVPEATAATGQAEKGLSKFSGKENPFVANQAKAHAYFDRVKAGEELTPQEMLDAYKATQDYLNTVSRVDRKYVAMNEFKTTLQDTLKGLSPEYAEATKDFARAATGNNVTNILPRTQTGKVSQGRVGFNAILTGAGGALGPVGAIGAFAASSPLTYGLGAGALGTIAEAAGVAANSPNFLRTIIAAAKASVAEEKKNFDAKKSELAQALGPEQTKALADQPLPKLNLKPDQKLYAKGLEAFLRNDLQGTKSLWSKALKANRDNMEAERGLERLAMKEGKHKDFYKPK